MLTTRRAQLRTLPTGNGSLRGIEGLRALAALTVVLSHTGLYAVEGGSSGSGLVDELARQLGAGVLLFFTLSGLLLYRPFADAILGVRALPSVATFLRNRLLRIIPAYWVVLLVAAVLGATVIPDPTDVLRTGSLLAHPGALVANLLLLQGYHPSTFLTGLGPAWTLVVEVGFYLALPVVAVPAWWVAGRAHRRAPLLVFAPALLLLAVGLLGKGVATVLVGGAGGGWSRTWGSVLSRSFVANADLFVGGMAVAAIAALVDAGRLRLPRRWRVIAVAGSVAAMTGAVATGGEFTYFSYDQLGTIAASLAVAVLVVDAPVSGWRAARWLEHRSLGAIGLVSYSVYLWHQPVIDWWVARGVLPLRGTAGLALALVLVLTTTLVLSALSYRYVERPALRRKRSAQTVTETEREHVASETSHTL